VYDPEPPYVKSNARRVPHAASHRRRLVAEGTFETKERAPASSEEQEKEIEIAEEPGEAAAATSIESSREAGRRQDEALLQVKEREACARDPLRGAMHSCQPQRAA